MMSSFLRGDKVKVVMTAALLQVSRRVQQCSLCVSELLEAATAGLDGELHQFTWEVQLDGRLNLFRAQSLLLGEDHQIASFLHDLDEELSDDVVDKHHAFLGDAQLWFNFLHNTENVSLEGSGVENSSVAGLGSNTFRSARLSLT